MSITVLDRAKINHLNACALITGCLTVYFKEHYSSQTVTSQAAYDMLLNIISHAILSLDRLL